MVRASRVILGLLLIPLLDALLLILVAMTIGWKLTVAIVVLTALVGLLLVRAEGRHTMRKLRRTVAEGRQPTDEIVDGGLLLVAGAFLLTPGLVTDTIGFLFVIPFTRYPIRTVLKRYVLAPYLDEKTGGFVSGQVYTFGFPGRDEEPSGGFGGETDESTDSRTVEFDDISDVDSDDA